MHYVREDSTDNYYKLIWHRSETLNLAVLWYQFARSKRVNESLKLTHMKAVPNVDIQGGREVWGGGATEKKIPRSVFQGKLPTSELSW